MRGLGSNHAEILCAWGIRSTNSLARSNLGFGPILSIFLQLIDIPSGDFQIPPAIDLCCLASQVAQQGPPIFYSQSEVPELIIKSRAEATERRFLSASFGQ